MQTLHIRLIKNSIVVGGSERVDLWAKAVLSMPRPAGRLTLYSNNLDGCMRLGWQQRWDRCRFQDHLCGFSTELRLVSPTATDAPECKDFCLHSTRDAAKKSMLCWRKWNAITLNFSLLESALVDWLQQCVNPSNVRGEHVFVLLLEQEL